MTGRSTRVDASAEIARIHVAYAAGLTPLPFDLPCLSEERGHCAGKRFTVSGA